MVGLIFFISIKRGYFCCHFVSFLCWRIIERHYFPRNNHHPQPLNIQISFEVKPDLVNSQNTTNGSSAFPNTTHNSTVKQVQTFTARLGYFLTSTGPADGKAFALLLIAGFAERFVPDNLMRLMNQKDDIKDIKPLAKLK